ncbi:MAG: histidine kinase [Candidatus Enteromonas sp.]|nr:histidine kinase [Candidatus Enteromonas sp.]
MKEKKKFVKRVRNHEFGWGVALSLLLLLAVSCISFFGNVNSIASKEYEKMQIIHENAASLFKRNFGEVYSYSLSIFYDEDFQAEADIDQGDDAYVETISSHLSSKFSGLNIGVVSGLGFVPYSNDQGSFLTGTRIYHGEFDAFFEAITTRSNAFFAQVEKQALEQDSGTVFLVDPLEGEDWLAFGRLVRQSYNEPLKKTLGAALLVVNKATFLQPFDFYLSLDGMDGCLANDSNQVLFGHGKLPSAGDTRYRLAEEYLDFYDYRVVSYYDLSMIYVQALQIFAYQALSFFGLFVLFLIGFYLVQTRFRKNLNYLFSSFAFSAREKSLERIALTHQDEKVDQVIGAYNEMIESYLTEKGKNEALFANNLTTQINKHFIANVLSVVHSLINLEEYDKANYCIELLSDFLRYTLSLDKQEVPLEDEIAQIRNYVSLQLIRYKDIAVSYSIDPSCLHIVVPKMILQPLVENAFTHGLPSKKGNVDISVDHFEGYIRLRVQNEGSLSQEKLDEINENIARRTSVVSASPLGHGLALINIAQRLDLAFGNEAKLYLESVEGYVGSIILIPEKKPL